MFAWIEVVLPVGRTAGRGLVAAYARLRAVLEVCEEIYCARALALHPRRAQQGRPWPWLPGGTRPPIAYDGYFINSEER